MKKKDLNMLKTYVEQLKKVQQVDRTWNFATKTVESALQVVNQDP